MQLKRKQRQIPTVEDIELVGGRLCLDFVNTLNREQGQGTDERFRSYHDVLNWSTRLGLIDLPTATRLAQECDEHPRKAASSLKSVHQLRECLWWVFAAPQAEVIRKLRAATKHLLLPRLKLVENGTIVLEPGNDLCKWLIAAIFGSAVELLTTIDPARIKVCPAHRCGWLFLDDSQIGRAHV